MQLARHSQRVAGALYLLDTRSWAELPLPAVRRTLPLPPSKTVAYLLSPAPSYMGCFIPDDTIGPSRITWSPDSVGRPVGNGDSTVTMETQRLWERGGQTLRAAWSREEAQMSRGLRQRAEETHARRKPGCPKLRLHWLD